MKRQNYLSQTMASQNGDLKCQSDRQFGRKSIEFPEYKSERQMYQTHEEKTSNWASKTTQAAESAFPTDKMYWNTMEQNGLQDTYAIDSREDMVLGPFDDSSTDDQDSIDEKMNNFFQYDGEKSIPEQKHEYNHHTLNVDQSKRQPLNGQNEKR